MAKETKTINKKYNDNYRFFRKYTGITLLLWTILISGFSAGGIYIIHKAQLQVAREIARNLLNKDYLYMIWYSRQDGLYLPLSDRLRPNNNLIKRPEKNIKTPSGKQLTLIPPSYMLRMFFSFSQNHSDIKSHISRLTPVNTVNKADPWERAAMLKFMNSGTKHEYSILQKDGTPYLRYIKSIYTEKSCLKCHSSQNHPVGSLMGSISVSVPWSPYQNKINQITTVLLFINLTVWIIVSGGIIFAWKRQKKNLNRIRDYSLKLSESEEESSYIFENTHEAIVWIDWGNDRIIKCNSSFEKLFHRSREWLFDQSVQNYLKDNNYDEQTINSLMCGDNRIEELIFLRRNLPEVIIEISATKIRVDQKNIIQYIIRDITQRKEYEHEIEQQNRTLARQNENFETLNEELKTANRELHQSELDLKKLLEEKNTLIRELYHRTKNTMQIIRGMLVLQADKFDENKDVQYLVEITEQRIQAISLVHQMLYSNNDLSKISMPDYINELTDLIMKGFGPANRGEITTDLNINECKLLLDTAIPFGLIINELITNSLKYAFPNNRKGAITMTLRTDGKDIIDFTYTDNGIGLPDGFDFRNQNSLGLDLIFSIGEEQMSGKIVMENRNGVYFNLQFPANLYTERV